MTFKNALLALQIFVHIAFVYGLVVFPLGFVLPIILVSQIVYVGFCGTVYFHRAVAHKNPIQPGYDKVLLLLSWLGISGSAIAWAGTHRMHHRFSDSSRDPHCPVHRGRWRAYWYSSGSEEIVRYVPDLLRNSWYLFQHQHYFKVLLLIHFLGFIFLPLLWYWGLLIVPAFLMWFAGSSVNIFCHNKSGPLNSALFGYLHAGEGWHKNHHEQPSNSSFRHPADWGYLIYQLIQRKT